MTSLPRHSIRPFWITLIATFALALPTFAEQAAPASEAADTSVANEEAPLPDAPFTIRVSKAEEASFHRDPETGDIAMIGSTLVSLLAQGYAVHPKDIDAEGIDLNSRFDLLLRPRNEGALKPLEMVHRGIPRALGLVAEVQERTGAVNRLRPAKDAPQLEPSTTQVKEMKLEKGRLEMTGTHIAELVAFLRWQSPRPVLDESNLTETYDFVLEWDTTSGAGAIFHALNDLGLEIYPDQGTYTVLKVHKPE